MAIQAGLIFHAISDEESIELYFRGFADRIEEFAYTCLKKLKNFDATQAEHIFKMKKEAWLKIKHNFFYDEPLEQISIALSKVLYRKNFTTNHLISVGEKFKFERFCEMSDQILKKGRHLWFCTGNIRGKNSC
jgi:secreted Zn-dependent insulinase-like peptidase